MTTATGEGPGPGPGAKGSKPAIALHGEDPAIPERLIIAPSSGTFVPVDSVLDLPPGGREIRAGDIVGTIASLDASTTVESPFTGVLVGMLAWSGERVMKGQALLWLRSSQ